MEPAELYGTAPEWEMTLERCLRRFQYRALDQALWQLVQLQLVRSVPVAAPAVGVEWVAPAPAGTIWELLNVRLSLTTSAVVANRSVSLLVRDGDNATVARFGPQATQAGSATSAYNWSAGYGATNAQALQGAPLPAPPIILPVGWSLASSTAALDAGDQYSGIVLMVRQWSPGDLINRLRVLMEDLGSTPLLNSLIGA